ncbi:MAG: T9SS type A sorting domain-containing protein [Saprospiraceae bacterium]|nr:T9SS type A sorting domain-containing protein [Saprospiraceae bacterium]
MKRLSNSVAAMLIFCCLLLPSQSTFGQCISAPTQVCLEDCADVLYIGPNSPTASYDWSISCGTISNPHDQNPHIACFNAPGICTIQLITIERGFPPDTCIHLVDVLAKPTVKFYPDDSICEGDCADLTLEFTGTAPFTFSIRDNLGLNTYMTNNHIFPLRVCPGRSNLYEVVRIADRYCVEANPKSAVNVTVFPPFQAAILRHGDTLCAFPAGLDYTWLGCGTPTLYSKQQCFVPPAPGCYMLIVDNGICKDTVFYNFVCTLSCSFSGPDTITVGDTAMFHYTGNGSIRSIFTWIIERGAGPNLRDTLRGDSIKVKYDRPGCYTVRLIVRDGPCEESCTRTICIVSRPCACTNYNTNSVRPSSKNGNNCCFEVHGKIQSYECYQSMQLILNAGSFYNIQSNTGQGWSHRTAGNNSFYFTHSSGYLPTGDFNSGSFCVQGADEYTITVYYFSTKNGRTDTCAYYYAFDCRVKPPQPNCDGLVTFIEKQHTLPQFCCYNIQTNNPFPNTYTRIEAFLSNGQFTSVTANTGNGFNLVNQTLNHFTISHNSGFIPTGAITPASFCVNALANPMQLIVRYYYTIPPSTRDSCNFQFTFDCPFGPAPPDDCCDSLKSVSLVSIGNPSACCFDLFANSTKAKCFSKICLNTNSGNFSNIQANSGWIAQSSGPNGICFVPTGQFVPSGNINPGNFCVTGANNPFTVTVDFYDNANAVLPKCKKSFIRDCPSPPPPCNCDSLQVAINSISQTGGMCCYNVNYFLASNQNKCFTGIKVSTSSGTFSNITCPPGFQNSLVNSQTFNVVHSSGHLPTGSNTPASFCVNGSTSYTIKTVFFFGSGPTRDSCVISQAFTCPPPQNSCNCDSLNNNIVSTSQSSGQCCYDIVSTIPQGNCFTSMQVSTSAGTFNGIMTAAGFNHSGGNQQFTVSHSSGNLPMGIYTPVSFCVSGASLYTITVKYFYSHAGKIDSCLFTKTFDCPPAPTCSCDSLQHDLLPISQNPGYCCYVLSSTIPQSGCFSAIGVSVNSGTFIQISPVAGWMVSGGNQHFELTHQSGLIPAGVYLPASFCVSGAVAYTITVKYYYQNGTQTDSCEYSHSFDCPPSPKPCSCDSLLCSVMPVSAATGICCYDLLHDLPQTQCFTSALISTSQGSFTNVMAAAGYQTNTGNQTIALTHQSGFLPSGPTAPLSYCVVGASNYTISVMYFYSQGGVTDTCFFDFQFDCPQAPQDSSCLSSPCDTSLRSWQTAGTVNLVYDLVVFECQLIAAGDFNQINNVPANNIAAWNGNQWTALGSGTSGPIRALAVHNGKLYAGGSFLSAGGNPNSNHIAEWDGSNWSNLDDGLTSSTVPATVGALLSTPAGLVVAGVFDMAGATSNLSTQHIALWDGSAWTQNFNSNFNGHINSLYQSGNELYAGGFFSVPHNSISRWDGTSWNALAGGVNTNILFPTVGVKTILNYNGAMRVGGSFSDADNIPNTQNVASWNGSAWTSLTGGDIAQVFGLFDFKIYENKLFAGGRFNAAGGNPMNSVAAWDGTNWISTGHPYQLIHAIESYDSCGLQPCQLYSAGEGFVNRWTCQPNIIIDYESNGPLVSIIPNPARERIQIEINSTRRDANWSGSIYQMDGKKCLQIKKEAGLKQDVDISGLAPGIYVLEIRWKDDRAHMIRFVKL